MKKILLFAAWLIAQLTYAQVPTYVTTKELVGYWLFASNAVDASGNSHNGTVNGAALSSDRFVNANSVFSFDNINSCISISNNSSRILNFSSTISFWFKEGSIWDNEDVKLILNKHLYTNNYPKIFTKVQKSLSLYVKHQSIRLA